METNEQMVYRRRKYQANGAYHTRLAGKEVGTVWGMIHLGKANKWYSLADNLQCALAFRGCSVTGKHISKAKGKSKMSPSDS